MLAVEDMFLSVGFQHCKSNASLFTVAFRAHRLSLSPLPLWLVPWLLYFLSSSSPSSVMVTAVKCLLCARYDFVYIQTLVSQLVQSLSCVQFFEMPWTAAHQASLSITNSWRLLKLMVIKLVMPSNHLILCCPFLLLPSVFPSIRYDLPQISHVAAASTISYLQMWTWYLEEVV